jgi:hypothetical protein
MQRNKKIHIFIGDPKCGSGYEDDERRCVFRIGHDIKSDGTWPTELCEIGTINVNASLPESEKVRFLNEAFEKVKNKTQNVENPPMIGDNLSIFWLTGLSQKKYSKTKLVRAFEYSVALRRIINFYKGQFTDKTLTLSCVDVDIHEVFSEFLKEESARYGFEFSKFDPSFRRKLTENVKNLAKAIVSVKSYFSLILYYRRIYKKKYFVGDEAPKKVMAIVVDNSWELKSKNGKIFSLYWPNLSEVGSCRGYEIVWIPLLELTDPEVRLKIERILKNNILTGEITKDQIFHHFKGWVNSLVYLFKDKSAYTRCILDGFDFTSLIDKEINSLLFSGYLKYSFFYSLIKNTADNVDVFLERKPFNAVGRVLIYASEGTPVIGIQHGIVNNSQLGYVFTDSELDISPRTTRMDRCQVPTRMAVFGERLYERMVSYNYPRNWLSIIGDMKFRLDDYEKCLPGKLQTNKCMFVIQYDESFVDKWLPIVARSLFSRGDSCAQLIIKPHPQDIDAGERAKNLLVNLGYNPKYITISTESFISAVEKVEFVVSHSSTSIIESLLKGKPVCLIKDDSFENDNSLFESSGCCYSFSGEDSFRDALHQISNTKVGLWDNLRYRFLSYNLENLRNDPYELFFDLSDNLINKNKKFLD